MQSTPLGMHLSEETIERFRAIWRAEYGADLAPADARIVAERFVGVMVQLARLTARAQSRLSTSGSLDDAT